MEETLNKLIEIYKKVAENSDNFTIHGCREHEIEDVEKSLDIQLPNELKMFFTKINGLQSLDGGLDNGSFLKINNICYLYEVYPELIETYLETDEDFNFEWLKNSIVLAGLNEETMFLLVEEHQSYKYYKYGAYIPGFLQYSTLEEYLNKYIKYLNNIDNDNYLINHN